MGEYLMDKRRIEITLLGIPASLNKWSRWHWSKKKKEGDKWKEYIGWKAKEKYRGKPFKKAKVFVTYYFKDKRTRDKDNYTPKFLCDSLKGIILEDDSIYHIDLDWEL